MSRKKGRVTVEDWVLQHVAEEVGWFAREREADAEGSPIEHAFAAALILYGRYVRLLTDATEIEFVRPDDLAARARPTLTEKLSLGTYRERWRVARQMPIGVYRADFAINVAWPQYVDVLTPSPGVRCIELPTIVVECDGHDFHERTPEQAMHDRSRDRAMTVDGIRVMRFTGREIYRDVGACVEQVGALVDAVIAEARVAFADELLGRA